MIDFEDTNRKHASDVIKVWLILTVLCTMAYVFGYCRGADKVQAEALSNGHMVYKDGEARWQPMRYIKEGN